MRLLMGYISYFGYNKFMHFPQPRILNQRFCIFDSQLLGKGSTGDVYLGFFRSNPHNKVAIKVIDLKSIDNEVTRYLLDCEVEALHNLGKANNSGHENVVKLHEVITIDTDIYLVMELLEGKTLGQYIKENPNGMPSQQGAHLFLQILQGYKHIASKKIVHRDLKPDNIIFKTRSDSDKRLAIIDFGYCEMEEVPNKPQMYYNVGSPKYMAPEAFKNSRYSEKSDIWALGIIFYEMLVGKTCDSGMSMEKYLQMIEKHGIPLPNTINKFNQQILIEMLQYNPQHRAQSDKLLNLINKFQVGLSHHKSQAIFYRNHVEESNSIVEKELSPVNRRGFAVQSMIISPQNNNQQLHKIKNPDIFIQEHKSNIFQPSHQNPSLIQKNVIVSKIQNAQLQSVRHLIHKKQFGINQHNCPPEMRQSIERMPQHQIQKMNLQQHQQQNLFNNKHHNFAINQKINPMPINNQENHHLSNHYNRIQNQINVNLAQKMDKNKVFFNFINNSMFKSAHIQQQETNSDVFTKTSNCLIVNSHTPPTRENIFLSQKLVPQNMHLVNVQFYSPQRQKIAPVRHVEYATEKKISSMPRYEIDRQMMEKPLINAKPAFGCGQVRVSYNQVNMPQDRGMHVRHQYHQQHLSMIQGYSN